MCWVSYTLLSLNVFNKVSQYIYQHVRGNAITHQVVLQLGDVEVAVPMDRSSNLPCLMIMVQNSILGFYVPLT